MSPTAPLTGVHHSVCQGGTMAASSLPLSAVQYATSEGTLEIMLSLHTCSVFAIQPQHQYQYTLYCFEI